jgi:hypothetical protein
MRTLRTKGEAAVECKIIIGNELPSGATPAMHVVQEE